MGLEDKSLFELESWLPIILRCGGRMRSGLSLLILSFRGRAKLAFASLGQILFIAVRNVTALHAQQSPDEVVALLLAHSTRERSAFLVVSLLAGTVYVFG
jgi:hypothetical protein